MFFQLHGYFISCCLRNPSLQVKEGNLNFFQIGDSSRLHIVSFLHVFGSSVQISGRRARVDARLLTWQVLPGGLGGGLRARRHLHLRAEHGGGCHGAALRGGPRPSGMGSPRLPWSGCLHPAVRPMLSHHKDAGETDTFCLPRLLIWASAGSQGFWCSGEEFLSVLGLSCK